MKSKTAKLLPLILPALLGAAGCATNPVTGKSELNLVSESQELTIGSQQYAPLRQSQGGDYRVDPEVEDYVNQVGQRLTRVSDRILPYEFKVLNSSVPNAWALPGGKIAVNRGLLTELQSEAELAAVLGHEVVHAAARHSAKGIERGMLLQGAVIAAGIATRDSQYSGVAQMGASAGTVLITQKYGRDAEREADYYGMTYMSRAGYDPQGAVQLQKTFVKLNESRDSNWLAGLFATHPPSPERVQNNIQTAAALPRGGETGEQVYRRKIARLVKTKPAYTDYDKATKALADGDTARATRLVKQAIAIEPREGDFHALLGDIEQKNKRFTGARGHYDKAISLNSDFYYYYLQRGLVNTQLKANPAARRDLERSVKLLPTANAYNALGDIARVDGRLAEAKQHYARAAENSSDAGKAAYASLVDLDLSDHPGKYLQARTRLKQSGRLAVEISNPTPKDVTDVVLAVQYTDAGGRSRTFRRQITGRLSAGKTKIIDPGISIDPARAAQVRSSIIAARIAR